MSSIWRYSTPLPSAVAGDLAYNSNYWLSSLTVLNTPTKSGGVHIDDNGNPSIFSSINTSNNFQDQPPETSGLLQDAVGGPESVVPRGSL